MKKYKKLKLRKLSIAQLHEAVSVKGGFDTEGTTGGTVTGPKTRTRDLSKFPEDCEVFSVIAAVCP
ncbi:hypothetical protein [Kordia sp.]|uniref:hypothetical protein n=1 Tax=Kordia sp. TaxID=1965332 RepID=UPI003D6B65EA